MRESRGYKSGEIFSVRAWRASKRGVGEFSFSFPFPYVPSVFSASFPCSYRLCEMSVPTSLSLDSLPRGVRSYLDQWSEHCQPAAVHLCDGSDEEERALLRLLTEKGSISPLPKLENW